MNQKPFEMNIDAWKDLVLKQSASNIGFHDSNWQLQRYYQVVCSEHLFHFISVTYDEKFDESHDIIMKSEIF